LSDTFSRQGLTPNKLKSTVVLHIGQPVKIVVVEPDRVIVAEQAVVTAIAGGKAWLLTKI
ncbi:hypothetical protein, partial [Candidatus Methylobacter favarea]|uniref:hypothetical protein n=1 Tax=Candidatus Methylobacter favarea TaxID=2707345 RepID=UPI001C2D05DB